MLSACLQYVYIEVKLDLERVLSCVYIVHDVTSLTCSVTNFVFEMVLLIGLLQIAHVLCNRNVKLV